MVCKFEVKYLINQSCSASCHTRSACARARAGLCGRRLCGHLWSLPPPPPHHRTASARLLSSENSLLAPDPSQLWGVRGAGPVNRARAFYSTTREPVGLHAVGSGTPTGDRSGDKRPMLHVACPSVCTWQYMHGIFQDRHWGPPSWKRGTENAWTPVVFFF